MALKVFKKKEEKTLEPKLFGVLLSPCITEKSARMEQDNFYVFKVSKDSNKKQVKDAVQGQYNVEVDKVMIVNIPRKKKFEGRKISGFKSGYKKAIVRLKEGQKIELISK
ncbi:MAG TPA: 50S ribosomal protein L23 [Candidatus Pacearchaeota archaeon]|nr:50S ribosomal protein L23 [Candidatus Pacearchaeota archaeon]HOC53601.1 50S ribosomal protein L23 [Candidatus Pacearchaeota archaeon]HQM24661.1 50S ribosomal protein L23 [Candidatus Pacearchaeota archaeon]